MLDGVLGTRLVLLTGATVPLPAGPEVVQAVEQVEVVQDADGEDGFQIVFRLAKGGLLDYTVLQTGAVDLFNRVVVAVAFGVVPEVLIDGIVTHHQVTPSNEPGQSTLRVTGKSVGVMLDLEEKSQAYPNQPDWLIVTQILASYAQYGLVPVVTPSADVPIELFRITRQQETDLAFVRRLAARNGYVFAIEPAAPGVNTATWGPEVRLGLPQRALTVGMGTATNVESLQFAADGLAPVAPQATVVEPFLKTAIPIPTLPSLRVPPLSLSPLPARRTTLVRETANQGPAEAMTSVVAAATRAPDPVTGSGELDAARYGGALRARGLVGVRGAGLSYDGFYYVRRVTHTLADGAYRQSFTISREGTGTLTPFVVP
ncbi:hypothetical protein [Rubrivirga sp.]|uniref:hypothetical protein n=1 Tax=Rubrivirga sp. TaxID=1885344 RepID=UPI003B52B605